MTVAPLDELFIVFSHHQLLITEALEQFSSCFDEWMPILQILMLPMFLLIFFT